VRKNHRLWEFESQYDGEAELKVVIGVDGGGTKTVCVCIATPLPTSGDDLLTLSRVETGCSNYNSVGGKHSLSIFILSIAFRIGAQLESSRVFLHAH
jgi:N-acetylglucosamine kinase-like BadF-type ATPase